MQLACDPKPNDPPEAPWPSTPQCEGLDEWPVEWAELERDALALVDAARDEGADCGVRGKLGHAPALMRSPALHCAARFHALDMAEQGYFGRFDPDGVDERARVEAAGESPAWVTQHLASGPRDAQELVERTWLPRPIPCADLVSETSTEVGLGHVGEVVDEDGNETTLWVVVLAGPGEEP
ncbi:MAG: hypothetical protein H6712_34260 [Myxococcales bacterium]|nr:hypothetical protein [Myxococcales bacterium]MCB9718959.1 hypothetical protein [Myxococcales bacterium]